MLRAGDIVFASFGHGLKTFKVRVAVLSVDWRHAMLIASDGEVYGPARLTALQTCDNVTDEEAHNWRARIAAHHHAQNEDANDDAADADADAVAPEVCLPEAPLVRHIMWRMAWLPLVALTLRRFSHAAAYFSRGSGGPAGRNGASGSRTR